MKGISLTQGKVALVDDEANTILSTLCHFLMEKEECSKCKGYGTIWLEAGIPNKVEFCTCKQGKINTLKKKLEEMEKALKEIAEGSGAFNRDPLIHASNCIESMKKIAQQALTGKGEE